MFKLRFWWVVIKAFFSKRASQSDLPFWVTPFECDINLHCNNASYLKFMDLGRWDLLMRLGLVRRAIEEKLQPAVVRIEIDFKKVLPPIAYFRLSTEFIDASEKSFRLKQVFHWRGTVAAEALVTGVFIKDGKAVTSETFAEILPDEVKRLLRH